MTAKKYEEAFKQSTFRQYWIINKKSNSVYGPYKKEIYLLKREELRVPKDIELKEAK